MPDITQLDQILKFHQLWLDGNDKGVRAILTRLDMRAIDLSRANLAGSVLDDCDFSNAYLRGIDLRQANLFRVNFYRADLGSANLAQACLSKTNFREANLFRTNLRGVDRSQVYL